MHNTANKPVNTGNKHFVKEEDEGELFYFILF